MSSETHQSTLHATVGQQRTLVLDGVDAPYGRAHVARIVNGRVQLDCDRLEGAPVALYHADQLLRRCPDCHGYDDIPGVEPNGPFRLQILDHYQSPFEGVL